ncbi:MAG TPA: bifunctional glutamate N-acetyltransferase/amino-acid acetyltransferase ArgJ [Acidobacteriaceae bacterium]|nr:bifunctional glutamate N-acetyltransferase/amino-acid acetyltransferase ArgJ [Acidobacteriaceae bacterium]
MSHEAFAPPSFSFAHTPAGFRFGAVRAGIKPSGKPDFACISAAEGTTAAAVFTSNRMVAAPVLVGRDHLRRSGGRARFVAVNAGNANCATGEQGIDACLTVCKAAAKEFCCATEEVIPSSTGIIGVPLPAEKLVAALPTIATQLGESSAHVQQFAEAILTTDTRAKIASLQIDINGKQVHLFGVAKGAGMIAPQLVPHATMLVYIFTDAKLEATDLQKFLDEAIEPTFNCISIDGDMSTNDTVLLLASGASGVTVAHSSQEQTSNAFSKALWKVCGSLARQVIEDGEGAGHVIELAIEGASSAEDAKRVARSIANSPLVKTAFAGCDPNWGRILAAAGYSGAPIYPDRASVWIGYLPVCRNGRAAQDFDKNKVHEAMLQRTVHVRVDLGMGHATCEFLTCDLTAEYVRINAEYST